MRIPRRHAFLPDRNLETVRCWLIALEICQESDESSESIDKLIKTFPKILSSEILRNTYQKCSFHSVFVSCFEICSFYKIIIALKRSRIHLRVRACTRVCVSRWVREFYYRYIIHLQVNIEHDNEFNTRVTFGCTFDQCHAKTGYEDLTSLMETVEMAKSATVMQYLWS